MSGIATSVIPLLSTWEKYISAHPDGDIPGFAAWVLAKQDPRVQTPPPVQTPPRVQTPPSEAPPPQTTGPDDNAQGALQIARLNGFLRIYTKPIIKDLGFSNHLEYGVLVHVAIMNRPNKKELCRQLLLENSTGVEITRRLAKRGLITEQPDPNDRRSARLGVTEKGKKAIHRVHEKLAPFHTSFLSALSSEEKKQLITLLTRLSQYHTSQLNARPELFE